MKIHGLVWLAIGAVMTAMSAYLGDRLRFFFYVGLVFVAIGVFKLIARYVTQEDPSTDPKPLPNHPMISRCANCRESVYTTAKFCHMCGAKISHT